MNDIVKRDRWDGWTNTVTGHGTNRDKTNYGYFVANTFLDDQTLDDLYNTGRMVARVCDTYPEQYFKKDYNVRISVNGELDPQLSTEIKQQMDMLGVKKKFTDGYRWENVFGGCGIFIGANDSEDLSEPLDLSKVTEVSHLNVLDKREMSPLSYDRDPASPNYGGFESFIVNDYTNYGSILVHTNSVNQIVHASRFIIFDGLPVSDRTRAQLRGWGLSFIQRVYEVLRSFGVAFKNLDSLIYDANQGVFKMKDFTNFVARKSYDVVQSRIQAMDMQRSVMRSIVVDADTEDFERHNFSWSGIEKPFELVMLALSGETTIPVAILMGREPAGQNATGESDFKAFYDRVGSDQENEVADDLKQLITILCAARNIKPSSIAINFESLYEEPEKDKAETRLKTAQSDKIYFDMGVLRRDEIQESRFTKDGWQLETYPDIEMRGRLQAAEVEAQKLQGAMITSGGGDVQREALNGAQMKSIVEIVALIGAEEGGITESQATGILAVAIPGLSEEDIKRLVKK